MLHLEVRKNGLKIAEMAKAYGARERAIFKQSINDWYNTKRIHGALGYMTPVEFKIIVR